jgi:hypothetical protein
VRALEHEGVLLRMPSDGLDTYVPTYDLLGGHIIASALLARHGQSSFEAWIKDPSTLTLLAGGYDARHPLADDILGSLVGQVPRRFYARQVWQLVDEPLCGRALRLAAHLEPAFLDAATVDALVGLVRDGDTEILTQLWRLRGTEAHPLNEDGLDPALRSTSVADRDLRWTEWLRRNCAGLFGRGGSVLRDVENLAARWRSGNVRRGDRLRARWVMWTLTSSVRRLRDQATCALYWFGRVDPEGLFELTIDSLQVNDAYVGERMLAAAYGVVMSHQGVDAGFEVPLGRFLEQLASAFVGQSATAPTHHYLARLYVRGVVAFAGKFYADALPSSLRGRWSFSSPAPGQPVADCDDAGAGNVAAPLHRKFDSHALGRLFDGRRNHFFGHVGDGAALAHAREVAQALGWRSSTFEDLDRRIAEDAYRESRSQGPVADRYGKKYGRIGFFTYVGILEDEGLGPGLGSFPDVDIDPSFPDAPPSVGTSSIPATWLSPSTLDDQSWIRGGATSLPIEIVRRETIDGHGGPWVAVHGQVGAEDRVLGRTASAFFVALIVAKEDEQKLVAALKAGVRPASVRDVPNDYYTFAGEVPWHPTFALAALADDAYREQVSVGKPRVEVEVLAHNFAWESHHSELNRAAGARIPSRVFSAHFDLRGAAQSFHQSLPDGSRATIALGGVDGLDGDILYVREDLLRLYVGDRAIVWFAFGERDLQPYPPSPPKWLMTAVRERANAWSEVITETSVMPTKDATTPC